MRDVFVTFRGEPDVLVDYSADASGPGTGISIEWMFHGKSPEEHDAINVTDDEEEAIIQACIDAYNDDACNFEE